MKEFIARTGTDTGDRRHWNAIEMQEQEEVKYINADCN